MVSLTLQADMQCFQVISSTQLRDKYFYSWPVWKRCPNHNIQYTVNCSTPVSTLCLHTNIRYSFVLWVAWKGFQTTASTWEVSILLAVLLPYLLLFPSTDARFFWSLLAWSDSLCLVMTSYSVTWYFVSGEDKYFNLRTNFLVWQHAGGLLLLRSHAGGIFCVIGKSEMFSHRNQSSGDQFLFLSENIG